MKLTVKIAFCALLIGLVTAAGKKASKPAGRDKFSKYSKEANVGRDDQSKTTKANVANDNDGYRAPKNYATTSERLFKILKIHNIWQKGQKALNEMKLKALYHDLKSQDKQELAFKKIKAQGKDKDGLQEAALRVQLARIIENYGLASSFPEHQSQHDDELQINRMFKDKKLNKMWNKVEKAGLDEKELKILKEELDHHQLKVDQYYALVDNLHDSRDKTPEMENTLGHFLEDDDVDVIRTDAKTKSNNKMQSPPPLTTNDDQVELVRVKHEELKENFDALTEKIRAKLQEKEFTHEKTIKLWNLALNADFTKPELASLRSELHHFEHRLKKLNHLTSELDHEENVDETKHLKKKLLEFEKRVEKSHDELRGRIARRIEL